MNTYSIPKYELYEVEPLATRPWGLDKINIDSIWAKSQGEGDPSTICFRNKITVHGFENQAGVARNTTTFNKL